MAIFKGAGVAIVTPMYDDGKVNYDKLEELLEYQIANSTDAIIICGTTGESSTMTHGEHLKTIKFAGHCRNRFQLYRDCNHDVQRSCVLWCRCTACCNSLL